MSKALQVRQRLQFDVERMRVAAGRLEEIDRALMSLRGRLEARAASLASKAMQADRLDAPAQLHRAQAQATAQLARRAVLADVLRTSPLALIAAMAVNRWVSALRTLGARPQGDGALRAHVEAGRIAHRVLKVFKPSAGLRAGAGQLVASVVVAELVHAQNVDVAHALIEEGLHRAHAAAGARTEEDAIAAASRGLRCAAELLESLADAGEPAVRALLSEADAVEALVARRMQAR